MSFQDGWAALHLEMPDRVPRTEYSLEMHNGLIRKLCGIEVTPQSDEETKRQAGQAIIKAFDYGFVWSTLIHTQVFGSNRTDMGHAAYQEGGADYQAKTKVLYEDPEEALRFDPWALYGAVDPVKATAGFNADYDTKTALNSDTVNMTGIYVTCMSGLIEIFGWDMLLLMAGIDPDGLGALTNRYCDWILQYFKALAQCKSPVVMIHDDIVWTEGAFLHPDWYRRFIFPNYRRLFAPLHEAGKIIMYTSDGNYTEFIDDIAGAGINAFVLEPLTDMGYIAEKYGKTHAFVGNADTRILLSGTKDDIRAEVKRCMDIGKQYPGFFMAVGNHIPPNTPLDNVLYYNDVYREFSRR
jgi:hypothetical protein